MGAVDVTEAVPIKSMRAAGWEPTAFTGRALRLQAPSSGAFFATSESGVHRSDDGGASWRLVPLPPAFADVGEQRPTVWVDPSNHARMFAGGWVTTNDGADWSPLGNWPAEPGESLKLAISSADPSRLYLAAWQPRMGVGHARMFRSSDGGESWVQFLDLDSGDFRPSASISVTLFETDPSNPDVVFHSVVGYRGNGNQGPVRRSANQGATAQEVLYSPVRVPTHLVGGRGATPGRFYCALRSSERSSELHRSDDGGATWTLAASYETEDESVAALAYDPAMLDRVYAAVRERGVRQSDDGGQTWAELGLADQAVNDLVLGVDGANLYAATGEGVFKLPVR